MIVLHDDSVFRQRPEPTEKRSRSRLIPPRAVRSSCTTKKRRTQMINPMQKAARFELLHCADLLGKREGAWARRKDAFDQFILAVVVYLEGEVAQTVEMFDDQRLALNALLQTAKLFGTKTKFGKKLDIAYDEFRLAVVDYLKAEDEAEARISRIDASCINITRFFFTDGTAPKEDERTITTRDLNQGR